MKVGIFGGCFNPIHIGHISLVKEVAPNFKLDKILFVPNMNPYYKKTHNISFDLICDMINAAFKDESIDYEISDLESDLNKKYTTYETIKSLTKLKTNETLYLIIGSDQFNELPKWKNYNELKKIIDFIVVNRDPYLINIEKLIQDNKDLYKLEEIYDRTYKIRTKDDKRLFFYDLINKFDISSSKIKQIISSGDIVNVKEFLSPKVLNLILENRLYIQ